MERHLRHQALPIVLALSALLQSPAAAQAPFYTDANQYFVSVPLPLWKREDFPSEQVRSKVAFHSLARSGLRVGAVRAL